MGLKSTRRMLSLALTIVIAASLVLSVMSVVSQLTIGSKGFYAKGIVTQQLVDVCNDELTKKYEALSKKSNIPFEVFDSVKVQYDTKDSLSQAATYLFDENDSTLNNEVREKYFYSTCCEYLDANDITYFSEDIENVSREAAQIYSDTVGIHNMDYIKNHTVAANAKSTKLLSICVLVIALACAIMTVMYRKKIKALGYISYGVIGGGLATVLMSLLKIIFKVGYGYSVSPQIYQSIFSKMTTTYNLYQILGGFVVVAVGIGLFLTTLWIVNRDENRKNTRFLKVIEKL